jgi:opacity protein-like surface antigen
VNVSPSIGWAIKDNLLEGFDLLYAGTNSTEKANSQTTYESSLHDYTYGAGFFLRKYKYLGAGFSVFAQGRLGGSYSHTKNTNFNGDGTQDDEKSYEISLGFYPGLAYAVSSRIQVEMGFQNLVAASYSSSKDDVVNPAGSAATTNKSNSFGINTGLGGSLQSFALGIRLLLDHNHAPVRS